MTDKDQFLKYFLQYQDQLRATCYAVAGDPRLAEDIFQETSLACWKSFAQFDPEKATFNVWANGVLRHIHANHWRRRQNQQTILPPETVEQILEAAADDLEGPTDVRQERLRRCLQGLSQPIQDLLRCRYGEQLSREALASRSGRSVAAVKKALTRARAHLANCMGIAKANAPTNANQRADPYVT